MVRQTIAQHKLNISFINRKRHNYILFDKRRLQQVLLNLLNNATKF